MSHEEQSHSNHFNLNKNNLDGINSPSELFSHLPETSSLADQHHKLVEDFAFQCFETLKHHNPKAADDILYNSQARSTPRQSSTHNTHQRNPTNNLIASPMEPSDPSSSDSSCSSSTSSTAWYSKSSSSSSSKRSRRKGGKKKKNKKHKNHLNIPSQLKYVPIDTTAWSKQQFKEALQELLLYDWDIRGLHIMSLYKEDELLLYHSLRKHKFNMEQSKITKLQKDLLDTAKKQNLETLKHQDSAMDRRRLFSRWIKALNPVLICFPEFRNIIDHHWKIHHIDSSKKSENYALYILVNSYVQGYWKNVLSRSDVYGRGDKALSILYSMCMSLSTSQKNQYNNNFTSISMNQNETATSFLRRFTITKRLAEEAGFRYSESRLVDMCLAALSKSPTPKYALMAEIYINDRERGKRISFATIEEKFLCYDFSFDRPSTRRHQANMSTHTSVDTP